MQRCVLPFRRSIKGNVMNPIVKAAALTAAMLVASVANAATPSSGAETTSPIASSAPETEPGVASDSAATPAPDSETTSPTEFTEPAPETVSNLESDAPEPTAYGTQTDIAAAAAAPAPAAEAAPVRATPEEIAELEAESRSAMVFIVVVAVVSVAFSLAWALRRAGGSHHSSPMSQELAARIAYGFGSQQARGRLSLIAATKEVRNAWDYYRGRYGLKRTVGAFTAFAHDEYGMTLSAGGDQNATIPPDKMQTLLTALANSLIDAGVIEVTLHADLEPAPRRERTAEDRIADLMAKDQADRKRAERKRDDRLHSLRDRANRELIGLKVARQSGNQSSIIEAETRLRRTENELRSI